MVSLPEKYNQQGTGSLKFAAQMLATHFHGIATEQQMDGHDVWPFIMILEDDLVLQKEYRFDSQTGKFLWENVELSDFIKKTEEMTGTYKEIFK